MSDGNALGLLPLSVLAWSVHMIVFHAVGFGFELCDRNGWLRPAKTRNIGRKPYSELLPRVLINQVFVLLPAMVAAQWAGLAFTGVAHLSPWHFVFNMILLGIGHDIVQYAVHRYLLHRREFSRLMKHGLHHSTGASQAISACYMSTVDFFLEIVLPYLIPLVLIGGGGGDTVFHSLVISLGAIGGLYEHSGYDFAVPFRQSRFFPLWPKTASWVAGAITSRAHAEHHRQNNVSFSDGFGSPGICDTLFGTRWDKAGEVLRNRAKPAQSTF
jgi:sterol desaturase/sphingolipid hydroxylase (fatty acid hydroxylase superfamily)